MLHTDDEWVFSVRIPKTCPYFLGHFPGNPTLPAIGHLALMADLLERTGDGPGWIDRADALRFNRPIIPGDRLDVRIRKTDTEVKFLIRNSDEIVSQGRLSWQRMEGT